MYIYVYIYIYIYTHILLCIPQVTAHAFKIRPEFRLKLPESYVGKRQYGQFLKNQALRHISDPGV